jgi:hypothetical protein
VSFAAITLYVASQRVIPKVSVYLVIVQSGNFGIQPRNAPSRNLSVEAKGTGR